MTDFDVKMFNVLNGGTIQAVVPNAGKGKASDAEFAAMTPAQRLDYCRAQSSQKQFLVDGRRQNNEAMPDWKDPRA